MRIRVLGALLAVLTLSACSVGGLFKAYEYEEEMYLALDGTATIYINSSVPALNALRGTSLNTDPNVIPDRAAVRAIFESDNVHVNRVTLSRRSNRRFVHIRVDVDDIERLKDAAPFSWSTYSFKRDGDLFLYKQTVGAAAGKSVGDVGWRGDELVAFRMHLPSKIVYHNAGPGNPSRGNILSWEQLLRDRMNGTPLMLDARMETQSILYRTLALFGITMVAALTTLGLALFWVFRRGMKRRQV